MMLRIRRSTNAIKDNAMTSAKPCVDVERCFIRWGMKIDKIEQYEATSGKAVWLIIL